jgi:broad specificity phosphatase PhoE
MHRSCFLAVLLALSTSCSPANERSGAASPTLDTADRDHAEAAKSKDTLIVVVRHAEKGTDDPEDPSLSEIGQQRALALAEVLADSGVDAIYTTQFRRTRETAAPLAESLGLEAQVRPIDASNAATYADDLAAHIRGTHKGQTVLVVGHSNTVPAIVEALSGVEASAIDEAEFTRLYMIARDRSGNARVVAARY